MHGEQEIRDTITRWSAALLRKDLDAMMAGYEPDAVLYDVGGQYVGRAEIRKIWQFCLPYFPETFHSEHEDMRIDAGGNIAIMHAIHRFRVPDDPQHMMAQAGTRVTVAYRKRDGVWRVMHEHVSMPFNFEKNELIKL